MERFVCVVVCSAMAREPWWCQCARVLYPIESMSGDVRSMDVIRCWEIVLSRLRSSLCRVRLLLFPILHSYYRVIIFTSRAFFCSYLRRAMISLSDLYVLSFCLYVAIILLLWMTLYVCIMCFAYLLLN